MGLSYSGLGGSSSGPKTYKSPNPFALGAPSSSKSDFRLDDTEQPRSFSLPPAEDKDVSRARGFPERVDVNGFFGNVLDDSIESGDPSGADAIAALGYVPGRALEAPIAAFNVATGGSPTLKKGHARLDGKEVLGEVGFQTKGAVDQIADALGGVPILGDVLSGANNLLMESGKVGPALVNSGDIQRLRLLQPFPDDMKLRDADPNFMRGLSPMDPLGLAARAVDWDKTVGDFRKEMLGRGIGPEEMAAVEGGTKQTWDFGDRSASTNPLLNLGYSAALDPTNLILGLGIAGKAAQVAKWGLKPVVNGIGLGSKMEKAGLIARVAPDMATSAQMIAKGNPAGLTQAGLGLFIKKAITNPNQYLLKPYVKLAVGTSAAQVALAGTTDWLDDNLPDDAPLAPLIRDLHDMADAMINDHPLSESAVWNFGAAFHFPIRDFASSGKQVVHQAINTVRGGEGLIPYAASKWVPNELVGGSLLDRAGMGMQKRKEAWLLERLGGEHGMSVLLDFIDDKIAYNFKQEKGSRSAGISPALKEMHRSIDDLSVREYHLHELDHIVRDEMRERGQITNQMRLQQFEDWFSEQSGLNVTARGGRDTGVRQKFDVERAINHWTNTYLPTQKAYGQVAGIRAKAVIETQTVLHLEDIEGISTAWRSVRTPGKTGTVPLKVIRETMDKYPQLAQNDSWFAQFLLPDARAPHWSTVRDRLHSKKANAPTYAELTHELNQQPAPAPTKVPKGPIAEGGFEPPVGHREMTPDMARDITGQAPDPAGRPSAGFDEIRIVDPGLPEARVAAGELLPEIEGKRTVTGQLNKWLTERQSALGRRSNQLAQQGDRHEFVVTSARRDDVPVGSRVTIDRHPDWDEGTWPPSGPEFIGRVTSPDGKVLVEHEFLYGRGMKDAVEWADSYGGDVFQPGPSAPPLRRLYREANVEELGWIRRLTSASHLEPHHPRYLSDAPEFATGQGSNTGIFMEFDRAGVEGGGRFKQNLSKPGLDFVDAAGGPREFTVTNVPQAVWDRSLLRFEIRLPKLKRPGAKFVNPDHARAMSIGRELVDKEGWIESVTADGHVVFERPSVAPDPSVSSALGDAQAVRDRQARASSYADRARLGAAFEKAIEDLEAGRKATDPDTGKRIIGMTKEHHIARLRQRLAEIDNDPAWTSPIDADPIPPSNIRVPPVREQAPLLAAKDAADGLTPDQIAANAERDALALEGMEALGATDIGGAVPKMHPREEFSEFSKWLRESFPGYRLDFAPELVTIMRNSELEAPQIHAQILRMNGLAESLRHWGPMSKVWDALHFLTDPVPQGRMRENAHQAVLNYAVSKGATVKQVNAIIAQLADEANRPRVGFREQVFHIFRGWDNLLPSHIEDIAQKHLDPRVYHRIQQDYGGFTRMVDRSFNRWVQRQHRIGMENEGAHGRLARALETTYGAYQSTGGRPLRFVKTFYPMFRFIMSPRYWLMNGIEANALTAAKYGTGVADQRVGMAYMIHRNGALPTEKLISEASKSVSVEGSGGPLVMSRHMAGFVSRAFDSTKPETVRAVLDDLPNHPGEFQYLVNRFGPDQGTWAEQLDNMMYGFDSKGVGNTLKSEAERVLMQEDLVRMGPIIQRLHEINQKNYDAVAGLLEGNNSRTNTERVLNSYFLYWPLSYQLKAGKWLLDVMTERAFGRKTNFAGAYTYAHLLETHKELMATDPEYGQMLEDNKDIFFAAQMLFPITPFDIGVSLNRGIRYAGGEMGWWAKYTSIKDPLALAGKMAELGPIYDIKLLQRVWASQPKTEETKPQRQPAALYPAQAPVPTFAPFGAGGS